MKIEERYRRAETGALKKDDRWSTWVELRIVRRPTWPDDVSKKTRLGKLVTAAMEQLDDDPHVSEVIVERRFGKPLWCVQQYRVSR